MIAVILFINWYWLKFCQLSILKIQCLLLSCWWQSSFSFSSVRWLA